MLQGERLAYTWKGKTHYGYILTEFFSRYGEHAESLAMANSVDFQWNQFWPYFHACTLAQKREAAQKADLHFAMQCKFLVSKYLYIFKSKWCWLGLSGRKPKAPMISIFYCTVVSLIYLNFLHLDHSTSLAAVCPTVAHIQSPQEARSSAPGSGGV